MDRRITRVKTVLDQQYRDPPSLEELAEDVALSASRLAHLFRDETGMSIQSYIVERRLFMAAERMYGLRRAAAARKCGSITCLNLDERKVDGRSAVRVLIGGEPRTLR